jgi:hypothetical protein
VLDAAVRSWPRTAAAAARGAGWTACSRRRSACQDTSWFARPLDETAGRVLLRGAVLLRARGSGGGAPGPDGAAADLQAALRTAPARPAARLLDALLSTGPSPPRG